MLMGRSDLLQVADALAREKAINHEDVITAIELAIRHTAQQRYGDELDIRASIDRKNGHVILYRYREVVADDEVIENMSAQIFQSEAKTIKSDAEIGEFLIDELPPVEFGRNGALAAKQIILQRVREVEREHHYENFKDKIGQIVHGTVKRIEYGNVTLDINGAEALMRRDEIIKRENMEHGERVQAYIYDVRQDVRGPQIFVSRTHTQFLVELFRAEVPEIYEGTVEIISAARDPGSRAKIGVISNDSTIDPVGACVGMRGSRVQTVVSELRGERIDIIHWKNDMADFVINAIAPAEVSRVVIDEDGDRIQLIVEEDQQSKAIGARGQNVRLASQLVGSDIDIITVAEADKRSQEEYERLSAIFMEALNVEEVIARLLITENFSSVEEIANTPSSELLVIDDFDETLAEELILRAQAYEQAQQTKRDAELDDLRIASDLREFPYLDHAMLLALGQRHVRTLEDFADLSVEELLDEKDGYFCALNARRDETEARILQARIALGWIEPESEPEPEPEQLEEQEPLTAHEESLSPSSAHAAAEALFQDNSAV